MNYWSHGTCVVLDCIIIGFVSLLMLILIYIRNMFTHAALKLTTSTQECSRNSDKSFLYVLITLISHFYFSFSLAHVIPYSSCLHMLGEFSKYILPFLILLN